MPFHGYLAMLIRCAHYTLDFGACQEKSAQKKTLSGADVKPRGGERLLGGRCCQALTAPEVMPSMDSRELNMNMSSSGIVAMTKPAIIAP